MSFDLSDLFVVHAGKPCWGCNFLHTEIITMQGEDFICKKNNLILGRIRKIMDGCIVPREIVKGCWRVRD
jgi:hypothetical protein